MRSRKYIIPAIIILAVLAAIVAVYRNTSRPSHSSQSSSVSVKGNDKVQGMSFYAPSQLVPLADKSQNVKYLAEYYGDKKHTKSTLATTTVPAKDPKGLAKLYDLVFKSKSGDAYTHFITVNSKFIRDVSASGPIAADLSNVATNSLNLRNPTQFTNKNIKQSAWRFDFSIKRSSQEDRSDKIDGILIYAIGQKATYRLVLSSIDDNWQSHTSQWNQVVSSLKIDE